ncbi:EI24 domain-containing protein [Sphingomonas sp. BT-65]|uniref:EI24 domain-containing protein n=1 Tax=Sphingomonas sp. BT-65 TaxID=2989821 RepID=UPI002235B0B3|nr:EI24 domain-containing protein [Sphingomonas sp. BT-65]MCW4461463.1 EI24 domain-containing protein [Sphingomonas sp. BT-65]
MFDALLLSIRQLGDKRILAVFVKSMLLTLAIFVALGAALWFGVEALIAHYFDASDSIASLIAAAALLLGALGAWLLFRAIAVAVISVFADEVVHAVEAKHYPAKFAAARDLSFARSLGMGLRSAVRALLVNLVLAPLYILLLVTGVGTALAFFLVNSWLLGRDLGDMVAVRHLPAADLARWRSATRLSRFILGAAGTALFFVPFVNLAAPVLGAAMATHLFHRRTVK